MEASVRHDLVAWMPKAVENSGALGMTGGLRDGGTKFPRSGSTTGSEEAQGPLDSVVGGLRDNGSEHQQKGTFVF